MARRIPRDRELQVLQLCQEGLSSSHIASQLHLNRGTVLRIRRAGKPREPKKPDQDQYRLARIGWCSVCRAHVSLPCVACRTRAAMANGTVRPWGNREPKEDLRLQLNEEDRQSLREFRASLRVVCGITEDE